MWEYNYTDELCHYGVKGMRWGHRKASAYQGRARLARASAAEWDEMAGQAEAKGKLRRAALYRTAAAKDRSDADRYDKKSAAFKKEFTRTKNAVKDYRSKYNDWEKAQNDADAKTQAADKAYKSLGKTKLSRAIAAARNKSASAKEYNRLMDEAIAASDIADKKWSSVKQSYKQTGSNAVMRVLNNAHYDNYK